MMLYIRNTNYENNFNTHCLGDWGRDIIISTMIPLEMRLRMLLLSEKKYIKLLYYFL